MNTVLQDAFLQLVRLGIGTSKDAIIPKNIDWVALRNLAGAQGLSAVVLDGIGKAKMNDMPVQMKLDWIGGVLQNYESRYVAFEKAISSLASFYNKHGYKMMVLKGYACSLDWPNPKHRPCGDIDIWQFGRQKDADEALEKEYGVKVDKSHHHHTVFDWHDFMVENHYDFINVHHHRSNSAFEKLLKEQGQNDSYYVVVNGERVFLPSPNLHALFLLKHASIEFAASGLNLRQLLDWAFYVRAHSNEIDWTWLEGVLDEFGMKRLYNVFNAICINNLGIDASDFPNVQFNPGLKDRVLKEILFPEIPNKKPRNMFSRLVWKWNRWKANEWKHKLAYKESMWSAFWSGAWNHLLKPSSI